jgi:hypothetical protein
MQVQSRARMLTRHTRNRCLVSQHTREVVSPQRTDLVLAADVPDIKFGVFVCNSLDVEADGGDGGYVLVELELVEDRCERDVSDWPPRAFGARIKCS